MAREALTIEDARLRLRAARYLLDGGFYGDALSRAYYGAHQAVLMLLDREGYRPRSHQGAHNLYRQHLLGRGLSPAGANRLDRLQHFREACDYSPYRPARGEAQSAIEEAEVIISRIETLMA